MSITNPSIFHLTFAYLEAKLDGLEKATSKQEPYLVWKIVDQIAGPSKNPENVLQQIAIHQTARKKIFWIVAHILPNTAKQKD